MGLDAPLLLRAPANVELGKDWTVQAGGFHVYNGPAGYAGGDIDWLRGDNTAGTWGDKRISQPSPEAVSDLSVSVAWRCLVQFPAAPAGNDSLAFYLFWQDETVDFNAGSGYVAWLWYDGADFQYSLERRTAGAALVVHTAVTLTADANDHELIITREVSGANRFWRAWYDRLLIAGPINNADHTTGTHIGLGLDEHVQVGGILLNS